MLLVPFNFCSQRNFPETNRLLLSLSDSFAQMSRFQEKHGDATPNSLDMIDEMVRNREATIPVIKLT